MTTATASSTTPLTAHDVLDAASVIPVLTVEDLEDSAPLAHALAAGGLKVIEATLRTAAGLDSLRQMKAAEPGLLIGMGSVKTPDDAHRASEAGADFLVTPGVTPALIEALAALEIPALPGSASASEAMTLLDAGFSAQKFFPAEAAGGVAYLKALSGPLPMVRFCPTGGVSPDNAHEYLALKNVACVGGSWIASAAAVADKDWDGIQARASAAAALQSTS